MHFEAKNTLIRSVKQIQEKTMQESLEIQNGRWREGAQRDKNIACEAVYVAKYIVGNLSKITSRAVRASEIKAALALVT